MGIQAECGLCCGSCSSHLTSLRELKAGTCNQGQLACRNRAQTGMREAGKQTACCCYGSRSCCSSHLTLRPSTALQMPGAKLRQTLALHRKTWQHRLYQTKPEADPS